MKADKVVMIVEIEVLSTDTIPGLLWELVAAVSKENVSGELLKEDGDSLKWKLSKQNIEF